MDAVDLSGRDRMVWNVLAGWGGHAVFVVAGFLLPHFIDRHLGQSALGIWDFGWSVVTYFSLAQVGMGSATNRYVAMYRASGDRVALNSTVSSVMAIQLLSASLLVLLSILVSRSVPWLLHNHASSLVPDAQFVVLWLGFGLAVQVGFDAFRGVLTGCHRWDLHNAINASFYGATVLAMVIGLSLGGGLRTLAAAHVAGTVCTELVRFITVRRVCPELQIRWRAVDWARCRGVLTFGGKVSLGTVSYLVTYQTTALIIAAHIGVPALALYARPAALVRHVWAFVSKLAYVIAPAASSMHASGRPDQVQNLLITSARYSVSMALPPLVALAVVGDAVIWLWMGPSYTVGLLVTLLALGHLAPIAHSPIGNVLTGLNSHGRPALLSLIGAISTAGLAYVLVVWLGGGLVGVVVAIVVPMTIVEGIAVPLYACRIVGLDPVRFYRQVWLRPLACVAPFTACLVAVRWLFADSFATQIALSASLGGLALVATYWRWVLGNEIRAMIRVRIATLVRRPRRVST